jgi:hypothetical protein
MGRIVVPGHLGKKFCETSPPPPPANLNRKKLGVMAHACHPSDSRKHKRGGSKSRPALAKSESLSLK